MMISDYVSYAIVGIVGFTAGAVIQFGTLKVKGKKIVLPFIESSARNLTLLAVGLGLLSLFTIVQVDQSSRKAEACQIEFQTVLAYNSEITKQERPLDARRDLAQAQSNQALTDFVHLLLTPGVDVRGELLKLDQKRTQAQQDIAQVEVERLALTASRAPYPEPRCGK